MAVSAFTLFGEIKANTSQLENALHRADVELAKTEQDLNKTERAAKQLGQTSATTARSFEKLRETAAGTRARLQSMTDSFDKGKISASKLASEYNKAGVAAGRLNERLRDTQARLNDIPSKMSTMAAGLRSIASYGSFAAVAIAGFAVKTATDFDSLKRGLTAITGSAEKAQEQWIRLKEVAKSPGLGFKEAVQGSINLQAAGLSAQTAERALSAFGNALATVGKGKAELDGVITALSQIQSKGKVSAEEINQLAERLPQIRVAMQNAFGTADTEKLQKMGISSEQFIEKVIGAFEKLPTAVGGAQNSFENFSDAVQQALAPLGQSILDAVLPSVDKLSEELQKKKPNFTNVGEEWGKAINQAFRSSMEGGENDALNIAEKYGENFIQGVVNGILKDAGGLDAVTARIQAKLAHMWDGADSWTGTFLLWPAALIRSLQRMMDACIDFGHNINRALYAAGRDAGQGLVDGLESMFGLAREKALGLANALTFAVKGALDIRSPSKVFYAIGQNVVQGFIDGIESLKTGVFASMARVLDFSGIKIKLGKGDEAGVSLLTSMIKELDDLTPRTRLEALMAKLTAKEYANLNEEIRKRLILVARQIDFQDRLAKFADATDTNQAPGIDRAANGDAGQLANSPSSPELDIGQPPRLKAAWEDFWQTMQQRISQFRETLPTLKQAIGENLLSGIERIGDVFGNAIANWDGTAKGFFRSLAQGFRQMVSQIVSELVRLMVIKAIMSLIGGFSGIGSSAASLGTSAVRGSALAFAGGGSVTGEGTGTSDSILARLSNGEFVMKADRVRQFGRGFFESLNSGMMPAFAGGGYVGGGGTYNNQRSSNFVINVTGGGANPMQTAKQIQREVTMALRREETRNK